jgi:hypothetical protein
MRWKYRKLLGNLGNAIEALCVPPGAGLEGDPAAAARELSERATAEGVAVLDTAGIGYATSADRLPPGSLTPEEILAAAGDRPQPLSDGRSGYPVSRRTARAAGGRGPGVRASRCAP